MDLPVWQALRNELNPKGLEIVTVALDTGGAAAVGPWLEAAHPEHPSLIDEAHVVDELFGIVNVPMGVWIDERGMIVRPPEPAHPGTSVLRKYLAGRSLPDDIDPYLREVLAEARKIRVDPERYVAALREWVESGAHALSPEEVVARSRPRPPEVSLAAAHFELGQHLHRAGHGDDAVAHFREAHRLQPDNWTYKRQAWSFVNPLQAPSDVYEGDWLGDVRKIGAENYYPPLDL
jgi:hypothetical protein